MRILLNLLISIRIDGPVNVDCRSIYSHIAAMIDEEIQPPRNAKDGRRETNRMLIREVCFGIRRQMRIVFIENSGEIPNEADVVIERQTDENCKKVFAGLCRFLRDPRRRFVPVIDFDGLLQNKDYLVQVRHGTTGELIFSRCHLSDWLERFS